MAFELMILGLCSRKYRRAIGPLDLGKLKTLRAVSRSAVSRRFVAASAAKSRQWLVADLGKLDPKPVYLFIIDGAKALKKALRERFGADTPIQRCQVHKARNIIESGCPSACTAWCESR